VIGAGPVGLAAAAHFAHPGCCGAPEPALLEFPTGLLTPTEIRAINAD
jgi:hypothetical protein